MKYMRIYSKFIGFFLLFRAFGEALSPSSGRCYTQQSREKNEQWKVYGNWKKENVFFIKEKEELWKLVFCILIYENW
jgi:hypothetical protein